MLTESVQVTTLRKSNYDKYPTVQVNGYDREVWQGYERIRQEIARTISTRSAQKVIVTVECYPGVRIDEILHGLTSAELRPHEIFYASGVELEAGKLTEMIRRDMTEDRVFAMMTNFRMEDCVDAHKIKTMRQRIDEITEGLIFVIGVGASLITEGDVLLYADIARWEIQLRYRSKEFGNWQANNQEEDILRKYKRGFFFEWRIADQVKRNLVDRVHYFLDTNRKDDPKMLSRDAFFAGLTQTIAQPFRVVPYFDPGVWGGQWMKEVCDLDHNQANFAWSFDGVPEENSVYWQYGQVRVEFPSINLVFFQSKPLLGEYVYARFGAEFPIRFDFLDTMGGQNLSLQVHPVTAYIQEQFGMHYTQDESYYMLAAEPDAVVYLGLKDGVDREHMFADFERAQAGEISFPAEQYINTFPAKKHDHFLIPAGTIHCSGANSMVLEISATPYIFTFKLWDWDRLGLDGKPRPVHLAHGKKNISWDRTTEWVKHNLVNQVTVIAQGEGWREERTGLHEFEFIETRRHWFSVPVDHHTNDRVQILNLIEGEEAIVESPHGAFLPFLVHFAETFIVPAQIGAYRIRPHGPSEGKQIATIKAYVK